MKDDLQFFESLENIKIDLSEGDTYSWLQAMRKIRRLNEQDIIPLSALITIFTCLNSAKEQNETVSKYLVKCIKILERVKLTSEKLSTYVGYVQTPDFIETPICK